MKSVLVHLALALVGLGSAYVVWTDKDMDEGEVDADSVVIAECDEGNFELAKFTSKTKEAIIERRGKGKDAHFWGTMANISGGGKDAGTKEGDAKEADAKPKEQTRKEKFFAVSDKWDDYVKNASPLRALRSLGKLNDEQLKEIELDTSESSFEIKCGGKSYAFELGSSAYGSGDHYAKAKDGTIYLLEKKLVKDIEQADSRLMQRSLIRAEEKEIEFLEVKAMGQAVKLKQRERLTQNAEWVGAAEPDRRNELFGNWFDKLSRVKVQQYLGEGEKPGSELDAPAEGENTAETLAELTYIDGDGKTLDVVELAVVRGERDSYYAKSRTTQNWVTVLRTTAKQVVDDLPPVVGLESREAKEAPPLPPGSSSELPSGHPPIPGHP